MVQQLRTINTLYTALCSLENIADDDEISAYDVKTFSNNEKSYFLLPTFTSYLLCSYTVIGHSF